MKWRIPSVVLLLGLFLALTVDSNGQQPRRVELPPDVMFLPIPTLTLPVESTPASPVVSPSPTPAPTAQPPSIIISGTASWGDFDGHVVTRYPRGTPIKVCGQRGCWTGLSWGYGPQASTGRIVDLDVHIFENICAPRGIGLCTVTLRLLN